MNVFDADEWIDNVAQTAVDDPRLTDEERIAIVARAIELADDADNQGNVRINRAQRRALKHRKPLP